jgi:DNA (cytosine-5)-methyltransferase 1
MRHIDLFSGIGGFALAASWVWGKDHEILTFCEKEEFPRKVLKKHWPAVPCNEDIHTLKGDDYGPVDLITGGFPCQPFSVAGKQRGQEDGRYLWPETLRIIQEARPRWFVGENVPGIINMALDDVLSSLEGAGYSTEALIVPACCVNAIQKRDRIWIVANSNRVAMPQKNTRDGTNRKEWSARRRIECEIRAIISRINRFLHQPGILGVINGIPDRVDRGKGLGNAIVPQVAAVIMSGIKAIDEATEDQ